MQYNITKYLLFNYLTIFVIAIIINYAFHSKMLNNLLTLFRDEDGTKSWNLFFMNS